MSSILVISHLGRHPLWSSVYSGQLPFSTQLNCELWLPIGNELGKNSILPENLTKVDNSFHFGVQLKAVFKFHTIWRGLRNFIMNLILRKLILTPQYFERFFDFLRPAFGHGRLDHPQSLEYFTLVSGNLGSTDPTKIIAGILDHKKMNKQNEQ